MLSFVLIFFFFKQKTAYEMRISDWSSDVCSSDLKPHEGLFYPRFNFLSSDLVPPPNTAERDTYLDAVAKVLIPESKSGDKYFTDKGRDCLTGFMHYLVSHVNDAKSDKGIQTQWRGMADRQSTRLNSSN